MPNPFGGLTISSLVVLLETSFFFFEMEIFAQVSKVSDLILSFLQAASLDVLSVLSLNEHWIWELDTGFKSSSATAFYLWDHQHVTQTSSAMVSLSLKWEQ